MRFVISITKDSGGDLFEDLNLCNSKERSKRIKMLASIGLALLKAGLKNQEIVNNCNENKKQIELKHDNNVEENKTSEETKLNKLKKNWSNVI